METVIGPPSQRVATRALPRRLRRCRGLGVLLVERAALCTEGVTSGARGEVVRVDELPGRTVGPVVVDGATSMVSTGMVRMHVLEFAHAEGPLGSDSWGHQVTRRGLGSKRVEASGNGETRPLWVEEAACL
jgi:hypothetical protein